MKRRAAITVQHAPLVLLSIIALWTNSAASLGAPASGQGAVLKNSKNAQTPEASRSSAPKQTQSRDPKEIANIFRDTGALRTIDARVVEAERNLRKYKDSSKIIEGTSSSPNMSLAEELIARALLYEKAHNFEMADKDFATAMRLASKVAAVPRAKYMERHGNLKQAELDWNTAVEQIQGESIELGRGKFYERIEKLDLAQKDFNTIMDGSSPGTDRAEQRSGFLERRGKFGDAQADLMANTPAISAFYERQGKIAQAFAAAKAIGNSNYVYKLEERTGTNAKLNSFLAQEHRDLEPNDLRERARYYERHGKLTEALADLEYLTHVIAKDNKEDEMSYIATLARFGKVDLAKPRALDLFLSDQPPIPQEGPESLAAYYRRQAELLIAMGKPQDAIAELATVDVSDDAWLSFVYGIALEKAGFAQEAKSYFKNVIGMYKYDQTKRTSIYDTLCAALAKKHLLALGGTSNTEFPAYLKGMNFVPLAEISLVAPDALPLEGAQAKFRPVPKTNSSDDKTAAQRWQKFNNELLARVLTHWKLKQTPSNILFTLNRHGELVGMELVSTTTQCGFKDTLNDVDRATIKAVTAAMPFPRLPRDAGSLVTVELNFKKNTAESYCSDMTERVNGLPTWYYRELVDKLAKNWHPPKGNATAMIHIAIGPNGELIRVKPDMCGDGWTVISDQTAVNTVKATKLSPLPEYLLKRSHMFSPIVHEVTVDFVSNERTVGGSNFITAKCTN